MTRCPDCLRSIRQCTEDESLSVTIRHGAITLRITSPSAKLVERIAHAALAIVAEEEKRTAEGVTP